MPHANPAAPKWVRITFRSVGTVNAAAVLLGTSFLAHSVYRVLSNHITEPHDAPYFRFAFAVMALIELIFVSVLLLTAIRFMQVRVSAVNLYSLAVLLLIVYFATVQMLWQRGQAIAMSVGAATAISSATVLFEFLFLVPFLYPVFSVVLLQLLKRRFDVAKQPPVSVA